MNAVNTGDSNWGYVFIHKSAMFLPRRINGISIQKMVSECIPICCISLPTIEPCIKRDRYNNTILPVSAAMT